jgi:hypothetical protein
MCEDLIKKDKKVKAPKRRTLNIDRTITVFYQAAMIPQIW